MRIVSRLILRNFRNYASLDVDFAPGLNLLLGSNGQGKTNVLEAVAFLALLRSFRSATVRSMTRWDAPGFSVAGFLGDPGSGHPACELRACYGDGRSLRVDGADVRQGSEFINRFSCVALVPEDIELVKGSGRCRRRFLDILLSQSVRGYLQDLQRYTLALRSRNVMLRDPHKYALSAVQAYDGILAHHGGSIEASRQEAVERLNVLLAELSGVLVGPDMPLLSLRFSPGLKAGSSVTEPHGQAFEDCLRQHLRENTARDRAEGRTRYGPHVDDFHLRLGERALARYGSEGECRLACLALRLACLRFVREQVGNSKPVVLLVDDVMGELDRNRKSRFFQACDSADQVFIAATDMPAELPGTCGAVFRVDAGTLTRQ